MKTESIKSLLVIVGAIIFNIIFWNEKLGINTILFDAFILIAIFYLYPGSMKSNTCKWLAVANLITVVLVIIHNTVLSKIAFSVTLLLFVSFSQFIHRSIWYAAGSVFLNYIFALPNLFRQLKTRKGKSYSLPAFSKRFRILIIPFIIVALFSILYALANTVFSNLASHFFVGLRNWFSQFLDWFSFNRFLFFLLGTLVTAGLILASKSTYFSKTDLNQKNDLSRKKNALKKWKENSFSDLLSLIIGKRSTGTLALKNEFIIGFISLLLLNILLLCINIIDIKYVWFGFELKADANLSEYVHEGAGLLIFSIVLAMCLLLFFFRANLNFYKNNKWLKYGAYLWIFQNLVLVISVLIRDYYYISHYGLAYKRIGLLFFLFMVLSGLVTVFLKIREIKTSYYLLRINAWIGILLLVLASTVHWDETIAIYNLERKSTIPLDIPFLVTLSDKTLPLLQKNKDLLIQDKNYFYHFRDSYSETALDFFEFRKKRFITEQENYSWLSWNAADAYVGRELGIVTDFTALK